MSTSELVTGGSLTAAPRARAQSHHPGTAAALSPGHTGAMARRQAAARAPEGTVIAYARVSSVGQAKDGYGLPAQLRAMRAYARDAGLRIVAEELDAGLSGTLEPADRPGLQTALDRIVHGEASGLLVAAGDRMARKPMVQELVLQTVWQAGGRVWAADQGEIRRDDDPDDAVIAFTRLVLAGIADMERKRIISRTRRGKLARKAAEPGARTDGVAPYGRDEAERAVIGLMAEGREAGKGVREIAAQLNAAGYRTRRGSMWARDSVAAVLRREGVPRPAQE